MDESHRLYRQDKRLLSQVLKLMGMCDIPYRGAGWAQEQAGTGNPLFGHWLDWPSNTSFGDDPRDQKWINEGILDSENNYHRPNACYGF